MKTLLFLHIPRTAGTTMREILWRQYGRHRSLLVKVQDRASVVEDLRNRVAEHKFKYHLIMGHFAFGLHHAFSGYSEFDYFTFVRDPVHRIVSHYEYARRRPSHYLYRRIHANRMSLREYALEGESGDRVNGQAKSMVEASEVERFVRDGDHQGILARAIDNLNRFFGVVGVVERFDESVILLKRAHGWRTPYYTRRNASHRRPRVPLDEETKAEIRDRNAVDVKLYEYAMRRLDEAIASQPNQFADDVMKFRRCNRWLGPPVQVAFQTARRAHLW